jgi:CrcB protein
MFYNILAVGLGGLFGSVARYLISHYLTQTNNGHFPWATTLVNVIGSIFIGILFAYFEKGINVSNEVKLLLTVGFCGGFTTFSTFSLEFIKLLDNGHFYTAGVYLLINVFFSITLCLVAYKIFK